MNTLATHLHEQFLGNSLDKIGLSQDARDAITLLCEAAYIQAVKDTIEQYNVALIPSQAEDRLGEPKQ
jgi:hypothetical protein